MQSVKATLCIIGCSLICKATALYQGNPASCELPQLGMFIPEERAVNFKLGYQTEKVFSKKMELVNSTSSVNTLVKNLSSWSNQGVFTLSIIDRVEFFTTLGVMDLSLKQEPWGHTKNGLAWSLGGKALVMFWRNTSLGGEASYLASYPHLKNLALNKVNPKKKRHSLTYHEWQIQVALSHKIDPFSLYLGGAYSYTELCLQQPYKLCDITYKNKHKISMALGSSLSAKKGFTCNIEVKLFGETSLGGNIDLRF